jgi:hypothetical protein
MQSHKCPFFVHLLHPAPRGCSLDLVFFLHIDPNEKKRAQSPPSKLQPDGFVICFLIIDAFFCVCRRQRFRTASKILALLQTTTTICHLPTTPPSLVWKKKINNRFRSHPFSSAKQHPRSFLMENPFFFEKYRKNIKNKVAPASP